VKSKIFKTKNFKKRDSTKAGKCEKSFELIFNLIMETFSTVDLGTDAYLIYKFAKSEHMAWLCVNIQTLIWPFFVAYVPFISYRLGRIRKESKEGKSSYLELTLQFFAITPMLLVYLFVVDLIFLLLSAVIMPILMIFSLLICQPQLIDRMEEFIDEIYKMLFGMQRMDVMGFRRLRTSC
jgi:hypothetical protein